MSTIDDIGKEYMKKIMSELPPPDAARNPAWTPINDDYRPASNYLEGKHTVERYIRVNVTKNTKGYNTDCTVSVTSTAPRSVIEQEIRDLLILAADQAEQEITRQKLEQYENERDI